MNRTGSMLVLLLLLSTPLAAQAQGFMSGTGTQPSTQLATPPTTPAIDQPGAQQRALARHRRSQWLRAPNRTGTSTAAPSAPATGSTAPR